MSKQAMAALEVANGIRSRHAAIKHALKNRELTLYEVFSDEAAKGLRISRVMESIPYLTADHVSSILLEAQVGYARPVDRLRPVDRWMIMHLMARCHPYIKIRP